MIGECGRLVHTFIVFEVESILLICDDLLHVDDALVVQLSQYFNLSDGSNREALFFIVQSDFL